MKNKGYKESRRIVYSCKYRVVWCPKYCRPVLEHQVASRLEAILRDVCEQNGAEIIELKIEPDHVRLLLGVDPQFGIHRLVKRLKGVSSRHLRQEFDSLRSRLPTLWTHSYFVCTVGVEPRSAVRLYVESQQGA